MSGIVKYVHTGLLLALLIGQFQAVLAQSSPSCTGVASTPEVDNRLNEVKRLRAAGKFEAARNLVMPLLQQYPDTFRVLYVGGLISIDHQNWPEAERLVNAAVSRLSACADTQGFNPDYSVFNTLGWIQMEQGHLAAAQTSFQTALSHAQDLSPASVTRAQSNLGFLYFTTGAFEKAGPLLEAAAAQGNANATRLLPQLRQAESIYQAQSRKVEQASGLYFVVALTSESRMDLERELSRVRKRIGDATFAEQFPAAHIYRPSPDYQYTLLLNGQPLPAPDAGRLKVSAISAGFSQATWLMPASDEYFLQAKPSEPSDP